MSETPQVQIEWVAMLKRAVSEPGLILAAYTRFHGYSLGNQLLAMWQCETREIQPGPINTFLGWKDLGRNVKKGARALALCMPVTGKRTTTIHNDETGGDEAQSVCFTRFIYRNNWFTLSQTEGAEYVPVALPAWDETKALAALSITRVEFVAMSGNLQGYAKDRSVAVSPIAELQHKTLFHEIAHVLLGHTAELMMADNGERTPKSIREMEAESVSLLVTEALKLPGAQFCRGYIQHWFTGSEVPERSAQRIFKAADQILKAGCAA